ncbi:N-acetyltransferase [Clostridia bacterium]|nr:N-acetyltransferase [Clostridia bacterium]
MSGLFWESADIAVRAFEPADLERVINERHTLNSAKDWYYDEIGLPSSEKSLREKYDKLLEGNNDSFLFAVYDKNGTYAGEVWVWDTNRRAGVVRQGIFTEPQFRGRGVAKQALALVLDYYFNELNYRKSATYVFSFNEPSIRFHDKFGYTVEGVLKEDIYTRGKYADKLCYALFRDNFNALHKNLLWENR